MEMLTPAVEVEQTSPGMYVAAQSIIYKVDMDGQQILWQHDIDGLGTSLIVANNVVYAYATYRDSYVYAFNAITGEQIWSTRVEEYACREDVQLNELLSIAVTDNVVYVNSREGKIFALDALTGIILWTCAAPASTELHLGSLSLTLQNDVLYLTTTNQLRAIDTRVCAELWTTEIAEEQVFFSQAIENDIVYASADIDPLGSYIYAFDAQSGNQIWCSNLIEDPIFDAPVIHEKRVYCTGATNIYALDSDTGELLWSTFVGLTNYLKPVVAYNHLYIGLQGEYLQELKGESSDGNSCVSALCVESGEPTWHKVLPVCPVIQKVEQGIVYVSSSVSGDIYTLDAQEGEQLWHFADPQLTPQYTNGFGASTVIIPQ